MTSSSLRSVSDIEHKIYIIRGQRVMIDRDLADLYGVETKVLNQAIKRNIERFPKDFMFQLNDTELKSWESRIIAAESLRSQIVTLKRGQHVKYLPYAFTEQGVSMLSSVLKSKQAIQTNIQIIRTFFKLREILAANKGLWKKTLIIGIKRRRTSICMVFMIFIWKHRWSGCHSCPVSN